MRFLFEVNGYTFGLSCTKASYKRMTIDSKTYKALCFIKYNHYCSRKQVQQFVYGESKYSAYGCFTWKNLLADKLIEKCGKGKNTRYIITPIGESYIDYINRKHFSIN